MLTPSHAAAPALSLLAMDYSQYKALQALLFCSLPVIWCVWQLIVMRGTSYASGTAGRKEGVNLMPSTSARDEIG